MTKLKEVVHSIPGIYRQQTIDNLMYGYVMGMQRALPGTTIKSAIEWFSRDFDLSEEDYSIDCALVSYYKIFKGHRTEKLSTIAENG